MAAQWLTTSQVLQQTDLAVTQQAIKKAAQREYAHPKPLPGQVERPKVSRFVRKNAAGHWEVRDDWGMFKAWKRDGAARAAQVTARHEQAEELARLRELCAEQAERIKELEAELAEAKKGTVPSRHTAAAQDPAAAAKDEAKPALADLPGDVLHDDAALLALWIREGRPSRRAFAEMVGMSKSWVAAHLRKAERG